MLRATPYGKRSMAGKSMFHMRKAAGDVSIHLGYVRIRRGRREVTVAYVDSNTASTTFPTIS
jgi:hypothetical protein